MATPENDATEPVAPVSAPEAPAPDAAAASETAGEPARGPVDVVRDALKAGAVATEPASPDPVPAPPGDTVESLTARVTELTGQIDSFRAAAEDHGKVLEFCRANGLSDDDVVMGFQTMALVARDPAKAIPVLENVLHQLRAKTGDALPEDLGREVDQGLISQARAKELALARLERQRLERQASDGERRWAEQRRADTVQAVNAATQAWFSETATREPDLPMLRKLLSERIQAIAMRDGMPSDAAGARAMADRALRELRADLKLLAPRRAAISALPSSGSALPTRSRPNSALDAVVSGLNAAVAV